MNLMDFPILVFALSLVVLSLAAGIGDILRRRVQAFREEVRPDFDIIRSGTLTLLGPAHRV